MSQRQYHYFIAGLPELSFDAQKVWVSLVEFKEMLEEHLHPEDFEQVKYIFLREDHKNLVQFIAGGEEEPGEGGNYSAEDFKSELSAILPEEHVLPGYMAGLLQRNEEGEEELDQVTCSQELADGYYRFIMEHGSDFLRDYTEIEYDMANLLTYLKTEHHGLDKGKYLAGDSGHAHHLRRHLKKSLVKDPEFEYFDEVVGALSLATYEEAEQKLDLLKWKLIDDRIFFEQFTLDWILGYLEKLIIAERWAGLKKKAGEEKLRGMIEEVQDEAARQWESLNREA